MSHQAFVLTRKSFSENTRRDGALIPKYFAVMWIYRHNR